MSGLDPAQWSWARLGALTAAWALAVALAAAWLLTRAMEHAKETAGGEGDFVTVLPYGTRHLWIALAVLLIPPLLAVARKLLTG